MLFFIISYFWIFTLIFLGHLTPWAFLVFLSVRKPINAISIFRQHLQPLAVMPAMKDTAITNTLFGLLLGIGILIDYLF